MIKYMKKYIYKKTKKKIIYVCFAFFIFWGHWGPLGAPGPPKIEFYKNFWGGPGGPPQGSAAAAVAPCISSTPEEKPQNLPRAEVPSFET